MKYAAGRGRNSTGRGDAGIRTCQAGVVEMRDVGVERGELLHLPAED